MVDFLLLMWKPLLACFILIGIHVYLGLHVLDREVIFVDLALAQIAALGTVLGVLFHFDIHSPQSYFLSLLATFIGAVVFVFSRFSKSKVPQEAIIGAVYVIAAALSVLILHYLPEGDEHIRHILVGNILFVDTHGLLKILILYSIVGIFHWRFRRQFLLASKNSEELKKNASLKCIRKWDFLFYMTFGIVVTSSVEISGVLMVFCFLIIPAIAAMLFTHQIHTRLIFGWIFGFICCVAGITFSYFMDLPTGAAIICTFAAGLLILTLTRPFLKN